MSALSDFWARLAGVQPIPAPLPASPAGPASNPLSQNDWGRAQLQAAGDASSAVNQNPGSLMGLINWIDGNQRRAMLSDVQAKIPAGYEDYKTKVNANEASGLNNSRAYAGAAALSGTPVDPANPTASIPAQAEAFRRAFMGTPQPDPNAVAPATPITSAASPDQLPTLGAPPAIHAGVFQAESGSNPSAPNSSVGAQGGMQVMPHTQIDPGFGVRPSNGTAADTMREGHDYLDALWNKYGGNKSPQNAATALAAYNWGPGNVDAWIKAGSDPSKMPVETQHYVMSILGGAQNGAPTAPPAPVAPNAVQDQRRQAAAMSRLAAIMGDNAGARDWLATRDQGIPAGTTVDPTGRVVDGVTGNPIQGSGQEFNARGADMNAAATQAGTNSQTPVQVVGRSGPMVVSQADVLKNGNGMNGSDGKPNWLPVDSPAYKAVQATQQKDLATVRDNATAATGTLDTATQLYNAANGLFTGTGAETLQDWRKTAIAIGQLTGVAIPQNITDKTAQFEQLRFAALNFVRSETHAFGSRVAQQIVKMIHAAKPGDTSSPKGLKAIITNEVIPNALRARGLADATTDYYNKNPLATDASTAVPNKVPLSNFGVKTVQTAQPGDYYVDPKSGNLRQRPVQ